MRCSKCGNNIPDCCSFCYICGTKVKKQSANVAGTVYSNVSNASTISGEVKYGATRGHGFAAERANHLYDTVTGKDAHIVGDDNAKNGADRLVDGVSIQSKYCSTGSKCIKECFDETGKFRYLNADGSPMQIEVPSDKYDDAVRAMEERIRRGQVPGVTDPKEAKNIVRKGHFTYEQAKNIAKFGTVESLSYDAVNGAIIGATTFGITTVLSFAVAVWNGKNFDDALHDAVSSGFQVGGVAFATAVLAGQLTKAGAYGLVANTSEQIVRIMGPKAASVVVLSTFDVVNIFRGRISGAQLFKNLVNTSASVAGGTAGWAAGASAGAALGSFVPGIGTAIGGVVGGLFGAFAGGSAAGKVASAVTDEFIEDDAKEMVGIIEDEFQHLAVDYLLNQSEAEEAVEYLAGEITGASLKDMYASSNRHAFARKLIVPNIERVAKSRRRISLPSQDKMVESLKNVLEEISDNN